MKTEIQLTPEDIDILVDSLSSVSEGLTESVPMNMRLMSIRDNRRSVADITWLWVNGLSMHDEIIERAAIDEQIKQESIQRQLGRMLLRRHAQEVQEKLDTTTSTTEEG